MNDVGLVGLGVMGGNLALNIRDKGYDVVIYNRTRDVIDRFVAEHKDKGFIPANSIQEMVERLKPPRKILLMVTAGRAVDSLIEGIVPHLNKGDVVADLGNSHFKDTVRRFRELSQYGVNYLGVGVSGGEKGALLGPSIMVGGSREGWDLLRELFSKIAAKSFDGTPCAAWVGEDGAGHYVKMVHNAIEYVLMELLAESYHLMRRAGVENEDIAKVFSKLNNGRLKSYLLEISVEVMQRRDDKGKGYLIDNILDSAEQKGTGRWAAESCLELGVPSFSFAVAAMDRSMSAMKELRTRASEIEPERKNMNPPDPNVIVNLIDPALTGAALCAYAQGFSLLEVAAKEYEWSMELSEIARIWQGGCIIRSELLKEIRESLMSEVRGSILIDPKLHGVLNESDNSWRKLVNAAITSGIPVPGFASTMAYRDSLFTARLPANLIQALRDYFGAHTYKRTDIEGVFHTDWSVRG
jgi:6-phosphogluconate dehydrogenase